MEKPATSATGAATPAVPLHKAPLGLRSVAVFEAVKGVLFLLIALWARSLIHRDVGESALNIVHSLHLDPAWHYCRVFVEESSKLTDKRLQLFSVFASVLALIRFVEAYGLWRALAWAEWFAVISAGIYLPWEIHHFWKHPDVGAAVVFGFNVAIVIYLVKLLMANHRKKLAAKQAEQAEQA